MGKNRFKKTYDDYDYEYDYEEFDEHRKGRKKESPRRRPSRNLRRDYENGDLDDGTDSTR